MEPSVFFHRTSDEIGSALALFGEAKSQLSLHPPRAHESFGSSILSIREDQRVILIDELIPFTGNKQLKSGDSLDICIQHRGVENQFNCIYLSNAVQESLPCHALAFPHEIKYLEKRNSYRVSLPVVDQHEVYLLSEDGRRCRCRVVDLSAVGAGIVLQNPKFEIEVGARIQCEMVLRGTEFSFPGRITHLGRDRGSHINAGVEFLSEESSELFRQLEKTMMELQRKNIRLNSAIED